MAPRLPAGPFTAHGYNAARATGRVQRLAALPFQRNPQTRPKITFRGGRSSADEAWVGQVVGTLRAGDDACRHCREGNGPFTECVTVDGEYGEACTNCAYQSEQTRCTIRINHELAVAVLEAQAIHAPNVPNMEPANNFGGNIADPAGALADPAAPPAPWAPRRVPVITIGPVDCRPGQPLPAAWAPPAHQLINVGDRELQQMVNDLTDSTPAELRERYERRSAELVTIGLELAAIRIVQNYQEVNGQQ